ncbi:DUF2520 domain-containing protein [Fusibacter paucivorans]|uniref:DUF2520 domain-containing protein n=1 Tax=Fusibacter paucivorans TaxID=76009 RepID=A0ABS5PP49_9FIRM|nr:DUF2520 domain-containing protein [Fusibacter paucivorans]MBS7526948.1 DUF2520 domain-containing protein [Fusibacter paucivorans]
MKIGFIGAGRVGRSLGQDLHRKHFNVIGYYSKTLDHAEEAVAVVGGVAFKSAEALVKACDFVFLTVNDDAIQSVVNLLLTISMRFDDKIIAHTSGVHASELIAPLFEKGASGYAIHPLQAFASVEQALKLLGQTVFSVEGTGLTHTDGQPIASTPSAQKVIDLMNRADYEHFVMLAEDKALYHAAAVISSNYLVATLDFALSQFEKIGCDQRFAMKALFPLIQGTIDNIDRLGTVDALTGPIARGDVHTVEKHLAKLSGEDVVLYKALGRRTLALADAKGLSRTLSDQLLNRLKED